MHFTDTQTAELQKPLDRRYVAERKQSGRALSYVEGWHVIAEANRIFGFDGWTRETIEIRCVSERERAIGQDKRQGWGVSYIAKARVVVHGVVREGVGSGHGIDVDCGLAHESAIKEAETDAMKRALMTFGNPFGLALYDKTQANVCDADEQERREQQITYAQNFRIELANATQADQIRHLWKADQHIREDLGIGPTSQLARDLHSEWLAKGKELSAKESVKHEQAA